MLSFAEFLLILWCRGSYTLGRHIFGESVFAFFLARKSDSFQRNEDNDSTHFLYSYAAMHLLVYTPYTIQVWGLVSFIRFGFCQSLLADKRKSAPHFLYDINPYWELLRAYVLLCVTRLSRRATSPI